jgi:hypothetical protein
VRAVDQEGVQWEVTRQWLEVPRWRVGRPPLEEAAWFPWDGDLDLAGVVISVALIVIVFVLFLVGLPLLVLLAAVLVAIGGLVVRVVFRRPWLVEAKSEAGERRWRVRGTLGSRRAMHEIATAIERGEHGFSPRGAIPIAPYSSSKPS